MIAALPGCGVPTQIGARVVQRTESGLQAHPLILLRLFFSRLRSRPIPARVFDFKARFQDATHTLSKLRYEGFAMLFDGVA
jgi:hypothetical protein